MRYVRGGITSKQYSLFKFTVNSVLSVLETVGLRVPTRCLRDFSLFCVCPEIKNRLLDVLQPLMLSAETLIYLEDRMFPLLIFYYKRDTPQFDRY
jgi:hypothetical protein